MVYTKKYFIEITLLEPVDDDKVFNSLKANFKRSFIKLNVASEKGLRDIYEKSNRSRKNNIR